MRHEGDRKLEKQIEIRRASFAEEKQCLFAWGSRWATVCLTQGSSGKLTTLGHQTVVSQGRKGLGQRWARLLQSTPSANIQPPPTPP